MASSRYDRREIARNGTSTYKKLFQERGVRFIRQYRTPTMSYPTEKELGQLEEVDYLWRMSDRFYKLADAYYGDPKYWWIIAWYNQTPTENHVQLGDAVKIPMPLSDALKLFQKGR